ncbi:MAG: hypothetical protein EZS28_053552 [Streblomastix strix]|uniref:Uncharacterized protein n=1 Tax=Streblomastix strix TaxID=222440 RepID=A0A5J4R9I0_9EUKA|nr:MAG: hypothetical protein EZS28_053552 [Streblomastix strix]
MKLLLTKLGLEGVPIGSRQSMCWRTRLSIGLVNPLCQLLHNAVIVQLLMMRIDPELVGCSISFLFNLDKMGKGDNLLIYTICQEHLLLLRQISFTAGANVSVALSLLKSNIAVELSDLIRRLVLCSFLQTLAKAIIPM